MIQEWMETYEEEFRGCQAPPPSSKDEITTETGIKIETSIRRGINLLTNFLRQ
jgi:hypothetical protein